MDPGKYLSDIRMISLPATQIQRGFHRDQAQRKFREANRCLCLKNGFFTAFVTLQKVDAYGMISGNLCGSNEHCETWNEVISIRQFLIKIHRKDIRFKESDKTSFEQVWEDLPLNAFDPETGIRKRSSYGKKSGVDREVIVKSLFDVLHILFFGF